MADLSPEATARLAEWFGMELTHERFMHASDDDLAALLAPVVAALVAEAVEAERAKMRAAGAMYLKATENEAARDLAALRQRIKALRLELNADPDYRPTKASIGHRLRALLDDGQADRCQGCNFTHAPDQPCGP